MTDPEEKNELFTKFREKFRHENIDQLTRDDFVAFFNPDTKRFFATRSPNLEYMYCGHVAKEKNFPF